MHEVNDVRQKEKHTAEPPVPAPSASEFGMAIVKLKGHKSSGTDQIPAVGRTIRSEIQTY